MIGKIIKSIIEVSFVERARKIYEATTSKFADLYTHLQLPRPDDKWKSYEKMNKCYTWDKIIKELEAKSCIK